MAMPFRNKYREELNTNHLKLIIENMPNNLLLDRDEIFKNPNFTHEEALDTIRRFCPLCIYGDLEDKAPYIQPAEPKRPSQKDTRKRARLAMAYPGLSSVWRDLSADPNLKFVFVKQHLDKPWDWEELSKNPAIGVGDVLANPRLRWHRDLLYKNPNITFDEIMANGSAFCISDSWRWGCASENPNLKWSDVIGNPGLPWNYRLLSKNKFNKHPFVRARLKRLAAKEDIAIARNMSALSEILPTVLAAVVMGFIF